VFMSSWLGSTLLSLGEVIIKRLPLVKHIYSASKQVRRCMWCMRGACRTGTAAAGRASRTVVTFVAACSECHPYCNSSMWQLAGLHASWVRLLPTIS
jgi:uncharacterized membrane protein